MSSVAERVRADRTWWAPERTLVERAAAAGARGGSVTFVTRQGDEVVPWGALFDDAARLGGSLAALGVGPGATVALLSPTHRPLVTAILATWIAGAAVVVLPLPPSLRRTDDLARLVAPKLRLLRPELLLVDPSLRLDFDTGTRTLTLESLSRDARGARARAPARAEPDAAALYQFTSGSTGEPKAIELTNSQICANQEAIAVSGGLAPGDRALSWLPLYHDMGLVGFLITPMGLGLELVLIDVHAFNAPPYRWMRWMSEYRATLSGAPSFAYGLAARALDRDRFDLSRWRLAFNGSEPIDVGVFERFLGAGSAHGLDPSCAFCVYGMGEAALAVTFPEPGSGLRAERVCAKALAAEGVARPAVAGEHAHRLARLGRAVSGLEIRVVDARCGEPVAEGAVGEVEVRGASIMRGYVGGSGDASPFRGSWLRTGDLGYLVDGELVICGRSKEVIISHGRNIAPQVIEERARELAPTRLGGIVAFGTRTFTEGEAVVLVAEAARAPQGCAAELGRALSAEFGVPVREVRFVGPGTIPRTPSGKLQRLRCREAYLGVGPGSGG